jgi:NADPH-dependent curcumin reductase CurA
MTTSTSVNRRILFARWPVGAPVPEDFMTVSEPMPTANPDQVLLRTLYLSLEGAMAFTTAPNFCFGRPQSRHASSVP